jgi:hypothetical protein
LRATGNGEGVDSVLKDGLTSVIASKWRACVSGLSKKTGKSSYELS